MKHISFGGSMASIRDVAKKANVAVCTVSRYLNGTANVAPVTKDRIEKAIDELNYIPNELARGMFKQKSGIIAMLVPNIQHPYFSMLADCIEQELYKTGYKMMLCSTGGSIERELEYINIFKTNIVDGIILGVFNLPDKEYLSINKPLIMLDYYLNNNIPVVVSDHEMGGKLAAAEFIRHNCKNVVHITGKTNKKVLSFKAHEVLEAELKKHGIETRMVEIKWDDFDYQGYFSLAKLILEEYPDIDGIMAADLPVVAFLKAASKLNKSVPKDICIISYDGSYVAHIIDEAISIIEQPIKEIGIKTVQIITEIIDGGKANFNPIILPVKRIE